MRFWWWASEGRELLVKGRAIAKALSWECAVQGLGQGEPGGASGDEGREVTGMGWPDHVGCLKDFGFDSQWKWGTTEEFWAEKSDLIWLVSYQIRFLVAVLEKAWKERGLGQGGERGGIIQASFVTLVMGAQTSGSKGSGENYSDSGYCLKVEPIRLPDRLDVECEERSWVTPGFFTWETGRMELPSTEMGKAAGRQTYSRRSGVQFWTCRIWEKLWRCKREGRELPEQSCRVGKRRWDLGHKGA